MQMTEKRTATETAQILRSKEQSLHIENWQERGSLAGCGHAEACKAVLRPHVCPAAMQRHLRQEHGQGSGSRADLNEKAFILLLTE